MTAFEGSSFSGKNSSDFSVIPIPFVGPRVESEKISDGVTVSEVVEGSRVSIEILSDGIIVPVLSVAAADGQGVAKIPDGITVESSDGSRVSEKEMEVADVGDCDSVDAELGANEAKFVGNWLIESESGEVLFDELEALGVRSVSGNVSSVRDPRSSTIITTSIWSSIPKHSYPSSAKLLCMIEDKLLGQ